MKNEIVAVQRCKLQNHRMKRISDLELSKTSKISYYSTKGNLLPHPNRFPTSPKALSNGNTM